MSDTYMPPFIMTEEITNLIIEIIEQNTLTLEQVTDVINGKNVFGPPANYIPDLMKQLFDWVKKSKLHPLVKSCIFHYEFEFIHPFADGNGRTGRLWQSLIL